MGIKIEGADKLTYKLQRIQEKAKDMSPAMKKILASMTTKIGTYKFYYKETKENMQIVRDIIREDEKYWWDKEKNTLYRYQNNPNIKNKRWK